MITRFYLLFVLVLCHITAMAQASFTVSGMVKDEKGEAVPYSAIQMLTPTDSVTVGSCISDDKGQYRLTIKKAGDYLIKAQMMGYQTFYKQMTIAGDTTYTIGLHTDTKELNEVKVIADRFQYGNNKYTVNMQNNPITQGKNITEVLNYLPGITRLEDVLYIHGEAVSEIYIDNRKVVDLVELEALQADDIQKIEVTSNAGAKLRADKSVGVIRIFRKKDQNTGYSGNVATLVTFGKHQHSERITLPFSYKKGNVNIYNYVRLNNVNEPYLTEIETMYKQTDKTIKASTDNRYKGQTLSDVFSFVYDISKWQNIGVSFNTMQKRNKDNLISNSTTIEDKKYSSTYLRYGKRDVQQYQAAVNYNLELDEKGSALHVIGDYLSNRTDYHDNRKELYSAGFSNDTLTNRTGTNSEQMKLNIDMDLCRWKNTTLSLGGEAYSNTTSNDIQYFRITGSNSTPLQNLCDDFKYQGKGFSIYGTFEKKIKQATIEVACRLQQDKVRLNSFHQNVSKHTYLNAFPELGLTYMFNPDKNLYTKVYIKRGMDEIRYSDMNPIRVYASDIYYETGNPDLQPITWYSVGTTNRLTRNLSLSYRYTSSKEDAALLTFVEDPVKGITYRKPVNVGNSYSHSINLNYQQSPTKWWTLNATLQGYMYSLKYEGFKVKGKRLFFTMNHDFRLSPNDGLELSFFYEKGMQVFDTYFHAIYNLDWRFYKYFFKKRLTCSISSNNIWFRNRILTTNNDIYTRREDNVSRRDYASISLRWNFRSKNEVRTKRAREIQTMQSTTIGVK